MKIFKKSLCSIIVASTLAGSTCCMKVDALFGNTHFNLGKMMIEKSDVSLTKDQDKAFLSGLVYADIGRFKFDKETNINSDSDKFVVEMKKYARTPEERWFVHGFEVHVLQDKEIGNFLKESLGHESSSYSEYIMNCSLLDSYFLKKNGYYISNEFLDKFSFEQVSTGMDMKSLAQMAGIPEDKVADVVNAILAKYSMCPNKYQLVIYGDLIKDTYQSFGFTIDLDDVYEQAANVVGAFSITSSVAGKYEICEALASEIEAKSDEFAKSCISQIYAEDNP